MSEENVEFVRSLYEGSPSRFFELLDKDVELELSETFSVLPDHPDRIRGKDAVIDFCRHYWGTWDDYALEPTEIVDAGDDRVLAVYHERGRGKGSGVPFDRPVAVLLTVRASKVAKLQYFSTREEALEAAGLSE
ncbi:MAG: nuclear transport factor 2 family protein [Solirubrobacterales bacterium]